MSLLKPFRSVIPVANNDTATYYVSMQPVACGPTGAKFVSANLTFQPSTQTLTVNQSPVVYGNTKSVFTLTTSPTPPSNPKIGDLWYDTSTDIQFEYINDGVNLYWVDVISPLIPGEVKYVYQAVTANQNTNIIYALTDGVNNYSNTVTFSIKTINYTDGTVVYWKDLGTANNNPTSLQNRFLSSNTGNVIILNNSSEIIRTAISDQAVYSTSNTYLQLGFYACASFTRLLSTTDAVSVIDNSNYAEGFLTSNLQYIIVGGGGGGGYQGGGGGGGVAVGNVIVSNTTFGSSLNVIVGGGGAGVVDNVLGPGQNGSNSAISGIFLRLENGTLAPTTTVTAVGGGGGQLPGGSGGGTSQTAPPLFLATQPSQNPGLLYLTNFGNPGGVNPTKGGGGGGGANTSAPLGSGQGQNGGSGYRWSFTANTYAGGGGGGAPTFAGSVGTGGVGGGGAGTTAFNSPSNPGTAGTGGGGGGAGQCNCGRPINSGTGGAGGGGVVQIAYQANGTYYTGGAISRSPALSPGYTIHSFTSPGLLTYNGFTNLSPVSVSFLMVGGGGAGGTGSVGNGAGGGGGGGGIVCGTLNVLPGVTYSISVGTGGWQGTTAPQALSVGRSGNNSTITGTGTIITALGGGGGSTQGTNGPTTGGSGGGGRGFLTAGTPHLGMPAAQPAQPQTLPAGSTSTNRGFGGGTGFGPRAGGGGGGAGGTGFVAQPSGLAPGGPGGIGYTWPLTAAIYGGGGGGGSDNSAGTGGPGGGGAGTFVPGPGTATAGTNGLGGGGGGSGQVPAVNAFGGAGGHGVVILAVPNAAAPSFIGTGGAVTTPGSAPGQTVFTYTAPTPGSTPGAFTFSL